MLNPIVTNWFEIPVREMDRAIRFYDAALGTALKQEPFGGMELAVFPYDGTHHVTGALMKFEHCEPSVHGSTVYLSVADVAETLGRIEAAGGAVIVPRTVLPEGRGVFAQFKDSEGNRVGLWSLQ
ncbi:VOC family protein [Dyella subtropica]|uniref:VOC family protein n=1 Tax=Dyella subtropica TaxID=2992127 RepID=UPI0022599687|nr:VOC family protein [Dyella subtropica]